jgi:hypothetical protein
LGQKLLKRKRKLVAVEGETGLQKGRVEMKIKSR